MCLISLTSLNANLLYSDNFNKKEGNITEINNLNSQVSQSTVCVYVESSIYSSIQTEITQYINDLTYAGFNVTLHIWVLISGIPPTDYVIQVNALKNNLSRLIIQKEIVGKFTSEKNIESEKVKQILSTLKVGSFSWPMKHEHNYIIVKLLDKRVKGDPYPFIEVEGKIMLKEYSKYEQKKYHSIVDSMKIYSDIKVYINGDIDE